MAMIGSLKILCIFLVSLVFLPSCVSASREGLPHGSPFAEATATSFLPQGIAVGDVTSQSALLWVRTDGPMTVQFEYAPVAAWDLVSKMATAIAPVARSPLFTTGQETDFTLAVPIGGLMPATRY